ncbi:MAG: HPr family phosphocarrier protein [Acidobacteriota bacterium]|jgi:Phosphotransferase System HPr (HPr) Family|nr:HPr family phosphocarrier protein [Acidobacteriota bacterium]OQB57956.1 MAG: HPr-like protein Crh [Candidatus Aminicenantes bacterium ADurb.Bin147]HNQ79714.1 HPr family phosphocarrier protein [Candidatus Aminicenantes bacterium]MDD8009836.1 HPr family phosphocarrier protein [Acidobacteriota bacterium]MDD8029316.1 HPr family phosphocarrier protein [Acidobacteriota bacterium]
MIEHVVRIKNRLGLHARAAVKFVNLANRFTADVRIEKDGSDVDGKSILGILTLAATQGTEITLRLNGDDEAAALKAIVDLIDGRFGEKE